MSVRPWGIRFALDRDLQPDLIRETAFTVFVFRVLEGLGAWLLLNSSILGGQFVWWPTHGLFLAYFLCNGVLAVRYRDGRIGPIDLAVDVAVNVGTMAVAVALTRGLDSPVVLIVVMKIAGYGLLFSTRIAVLAVAMAALSFFLALNLVFPNLGVVQVLWRSGGRDDILRAILLVVVLTGGLWLFHRVTANERRIARIAAEIEAKKRLIAREFKSAKAATERADDAYTESVALDGVSETLSGFTESDEILHKVVEIARGILWWDYCLILLWDDQTQSYRCSEVAGFEPSRARQLRGLRLSPDDEPDLEWVRRLGHCALVAPRDDGHLRGGESPTLLTAPLFRNSEFYGVLQFARTGGQQDFTTNDLRLADRLVARTATALQRARHLKEQHEADRLSAAAELAEGVAHEVNNALTGIQGQVRAVEGSDNPDLLRGALDKVEAQSHRIAAIIQELLGFGRLKQPARVPVDLEDLVGETLALMEHDLTRGKIAVRTSFPVGTKPVLVDRRQIQQVLVNLVTNAIHAMEPGGGRLEFSAHEGHNVVYLETTDSGQGIPEDQLPRVFDPFFSTKKKGTGLGLSVSFNILRAHGGDLSVESTLGHGATFTIRLPTFIERKSAPLHSVLLVDDEPAVAASIEDMLVRQGLRVHRAATGQEALDSVAKDSFDAIFLDVKLPDISGPEVYSRILADNPAMARRVIFVTGGLWRFDRRGFRDKLPAQPLLAKPCTAEQIREVLRQLGETVEAD